MAWTKLEPAKAKQGSTAKLTVTATKNRQLVISLPGALCGAKGWDAFEQADIFLGEGETAGQLRIDPAKAGSARLTRFKTAIVVRVAVQPQWRNEPGNLGQAALNFEPGGAVVFALPPRLLTNGLAAASPVVAEAVAEAARSGPPKGLDCIGSVVSLGRKQVSLTPSELTLFEALRRHWGNVASKSLLMDNLYGGDPNGGAEEKTLDVMIYKLRKKLAGLGIDVVTHWGQGWSLAMLGAPSS